MTYLPEVRDALASTAGRPADRPARHRLGLERVAGWAIPALSVIATLAIAALVILSVHGARAGRQLPPTAISPTVQSAWKQDDLKAMTVVSQRDSGCRLASTLRAPRDQRILSGAPTRRLSSLLAVLQRPAPAAARVSSAQLRRLNVDGQGIYLRYARSGVADGVHYEIIPVEHLEPDELPARCFAEQLTTFTQLLSTTVPPAQRASATQFELAQIRRRKGPQPPGIVVFTRGGGEAARSYLVPVGALRHNPYRTGASDGDDTIIQTVQIVPNAVATVTARYPAQAYPGRVSRPVTVTQPVENNLVIFAYHGAYDPPQLTFRSATGQVLFSSAKQRRRSESTEPTTAFPGAPASQANSGVDTGFCPLAPANRYLPSRSGCVEARQADVNGDGRPELVLLYSRLTHARAQGTGVPSGLKRQFEARQAVLEVVTQAGATVSVALTQGSSPLHDGPVPAAAILAITHLNRQPSDEVLLDTGHISSGSTAAIYALSGGHIIPAGVTLGWGGDSATQAGFTCLGGRSPGVLQRSFALIGPTIYGSWRETDTVYAWHGPRLIRVSQRSFTHHGLPHDQETDVAQSCLMGIQN